MLNLGFFKISLLMSLFFPQAATIDFQKMSKQRIRTRPWVPSTSVKSTNRGIYREVQSIHTPQPVRILDA